MKKKSLVLDKVQRLDVLARSMRDRYDNVERLAEAAWSKSREGLAEVLLFGRDAIEAKEIIGHGKWIDWLSKHVKKAKPRRVQQWIEMAQADPKLLEEAESIQGGLRLLGKAYAEPKTHVRAYLSPPQSAQLTNGQPDAPKVEPAVIDAEVVAEEVLPAQITDTIRLNWLIKQGPPGAAIGIGLNGEAWELASENVRETFSAEENQDRYCMRRAIDAAINATA